MLVVQKKKKKKHTPGMSWTPNSTSHTLWTTQSLVQSVSDAKSNSWLKERGQHLPYRGHLETQRLKPLLLLLLPPSWLIDNDSLLALPLWLAMYYGGGGSHT
jgi:hypothetical protein